MLNVPVVRPTSAGKKQAILSGTPVTIEDRLYRGEPAMTVSAGPRLGWLPSWTTKLITLPAVETMSIARVDEPDKGQRKIWISLPEFSFSTLDDEMVVVDLETTGLDAEADDIIEIGAVRFKRDAVIDEFQTFVKPRRPVPAFITSYTGISNAMVVNAPPPEYALIDFYRFLGQRPLVAHNSGFDCGFLTATARRVFGNAPSPTVFCTLRISRQILPNQSHRLGDLASSLGVKPQDAHRALGDARTTHGVWNALFDGRAASLAG